MKPRLTKNGRALLTKALAAIRRRPETFKMRVWMQHDERVKGRHPYCGTVACLAGHIVLAAGAPPIHADAYASLAGFPRGLRRVAREIQRNTITGCIPISTLAARLVDRDTEPDYGGIHNVFASMRCTTHAKIKARVERWLKTGE